MIDTEPQTQKSLGKFPQGLLHNTLIFSELTEPDYLTSRERR